MKIKNITAIATAILGFSNINTRKKQILIPYNMKKILLALAIGFTAMACRDKEEPQDQLPPITQHGANTAGCLVNGKVLIPTHQSGLSAPYSYPLNSEIYDEKGVYISISGLRTKENGKHLYGYLYLYIKGNSVGHYTLSKAYYSPYPIKNSTFIIYNRNNKSYYSNTNSGYIKITTYNYPIVSGVFSGELYNKDNPSDKIQITNGRFDININTLNK